MKNKSVITSTAILNSFTRLYIKREISTYQNEQLILESVTEKDFSLREVSKEELFQLRVSKLPGFVIKVDDSYYYTELSTDLRVEDYTAIAQSILGVHCCSKGTSECKHLSASQNGGCPKVQDCSIRYYLKYKNADKFANEFSNESDDEAYKSAVRLSKRIEKYNFITLGYEGFNIPNDFLVVIHCNCYQKEVWKKPKTKNKKEPSC